MGCDLLASEPRKHWPGRAWPDSDHAELGPGPGPPVGRGPSPSQAGAEHDPGLEPSSGWGRAGRGRVAAKA